MEEEYTDNEKTLLGEHLMLNRNGNESWIVHWHQIKSNLIDIYPLFIFMFCVVGLVGVVGNCVMLFKIFNEYYSIRSIRQLFPSNTIFLIGNLAVSDTLKALVVMPISVSVLLLQNWVFGSFMCFFLPMIQSLQLHVSMLTYVLIAVDRYRQIIHPSKTPIPAAMCTIAVWIISICLVSPFAFYLGYIDYGGVIPEFKGLGFCHVQVEKPYHQYVRGVFVTLYVMPLTIITFLHVKISAEIKSKMAIRAMAQAENTLRNIREVACAPRDSRMEPDGESGDSPSHTGTYYINGRCQVSISVRDCDEDDDDVDVLKEKRTQKFMVTMVMLFGILWCPLQILYLVTPVLVHNETEEKSRNIDMSFLVFTWVGFLSTCVNPSIFTTWQTSNGIISKLKLCLCLTKSRQNPLSTRGTVLGDHQLHNFRYSDTSTDHTEIFSNAKSFLDEIDTHNL